MNIVNLATDKDKTYSFSGLVRKTTYISKVCASPTTCDRDKIMHWIEQQVVVQVTAQHLALHLDPSDRGNVGKLRNLFPDINKMMDDVSTGGGKDGGHGMVIAVHLYKLQRSSRKFTDLIVKNDAGVIHRINCLKPFTEQLKV